MEETAPFFAPCGGTGGSAAGGGPVPPPEGEAAEAGIPKGRSFDEGPLPTTAGPLAGAQASFRPVNIGTRTAVGAESAPYGRRGRRRCDGRPSEGAKPVAGPAGFCSGLRLAGGGCLRKAGTQRARPIPVVATGSRVVFILPGGLAEGPRDWRIPSVPGRALRRSGPAGGGLPPGKAGNMEGGREARDLWSAFENGTESAGKGGVRQPRL